MADKEKAPQIPRSIRKEAGKISHARVVQGIMDLEEVDDRIFARLDALAGQVAKQGGQIERLIAWIADSDVEGYRTTYRDRANIIAALRGTGQPEPAAEPPKADDGYTTVQDEHGLTAEQRDDDQPRSNWKPPQAEPRTHDLKCWPKYFKALRDGTKTFELRLNDRDYRVGDVLLIREWNQHRKAYTGEVERRRVTYLLKADDGPFLMDGFCCMGLASYGAPADPPAEDREALPCPVCGEPAVSIGDCISCANPDCGLNDSNNCLDRDTWDALPRRAAVRAAVLDEVEQALTKLPCRPIDAHAHLVFHDLLAALRQKEGQ